MASQVMKMVLQASIMSVTSNILAQAITAYKSNAPFSIQWTPIYQFVLFTILSTPPNYLFQSFLESILPSTTIVPSKQGIEEASSAGDSPAPALEEKKPIVERRLNVTNTIIKFLIDQTLCASLNTIGFSAGMAGIKGASTSQAMQIAKQDFWPMMSAGWRLWPFVSLANYSVVKTVEARQFVGSCAGLVWGIYLSLISAGK